MHTSQEDRQELVVQVLDAHTAIPDWLTFADISSSAYRTAAAMLASKPLPPTQDDLAARLGVDVRSVKRWQDELRNAQVMTTYRIGRRWFNVFHKPSDADRWRKDHLPSGKVIERSGIDGSGMPRSGIVGSPNGHEVEASFVASSSSKSAIGDRSIPDPTPSSSSKHDLSKKETNTTTQSRASTKVRPSDIKTALGCLMVTPEWGFNLVCAVELQHLDLEACKADRAARMARGQGPGQIINAWRVEPPTLPASLPAQTDDWTSRYTNDPQYAGMFKLGSDVSDFDRTDPNVDKFLKECGL